MSKASTTEHAVSEETLTNEQLVKLVRSLQAKSTDLEAQLGKQAAKAEGEVEYYQCNACGVKLEAGKRCPTHPNDQVNGIGTVFNPRSNTVRTGIVSRS